MDEIHREPCTTKTVLPIPQQSSQAPHQPVLPFDDESGRQTHDVDPLTAYRVALQEYCKQILAPASVYAAARLRLHASRAFLVASLPTLEPRDREISLRCLRDEGEVYTAMSSTLLAANGAYDK